jgi:D-psicose/D-tagatose/L-ribulose 3-epimerase
VGQFRRVKGWGYDIVEVCIENPAVLTPSRVRAAAADEGVSVLVCGAFGPGRDVSHEDASVRAGGIDYLKRCLDFAAEVDSPLVSGPMYAQTGVTRLLEPTERDAQRVRAVASLAAVAEYAASRGIRLAVEPLNRFETDLVNTVEQGLALCSAVGAPNIGLLLDTFHMNIEEKDICAAIESAGDRVFHVQASENDRGTPGAGHVPWRNVIASLRGIDYAGSIVVESFLPTVKEIARAVSQWRPVAKSMDDLAADAFTYLSPLLQP